MFFDFDNLTTSYSSNYNFKEEDDKYIFETDMPGYDKENISVKLKGKILNILANSKERGDIKRTYNVSNLDIKDIEAKYKSGVLKLNILKNKENVKTININ